MAKKKTSVSACLRSRPCMEFVLDGLESAYHAAGADRRREESIEVAIQMVKDRLKKLKK